MIRVAVCGACGRMGKLITREVTNQPDMKVVAGIDAPRTPEAGKDVGEIAGIGNLGVAVTGAERLAEILRTTKADVLVDFTNADAVIENVSTAVREGVAVVIGTTGFTPKQRVKIFEDVKRARVSALMTPNMSVGVNVFFKLAEEATRSLGRDYDVDVIEAHHAHKADAPSGTALRAAEIVAKGLGLSPKNIRCGRPAGRRPRKKGEVTIHSIRAGGTVGEHTVVFTAPSERVEIVHRAQSREAFAAGTVKAIRHVIKKGKPGVVQEMRDVLGLK